MNTGVQSGQDVIIERLSLISSTNTITPLLDFLVELSIYEDINSNVLTGHLILSDSRGLIDKLPIIGDELLSIKITTPTFTQSIEKTFRTYRISDRTIVRDNNTQTYILHFSSIELFYDVSLPLYLPFSGRIQDVVERIYLDFISTSREYEISNNDSKIQEIDSITPLLLLNEIENKVKYVSPGWTPFKNLNWLASKSIAKDETASSFLFWESNKAFYFGSIEYLMKEGINRSIGTYTPTVSGLYNESGTVDHNREKFILSDLKIVENFDQIKNLTNGYLASSVIDVDVYNREYNVIQYDYVEQYKNQFHTSGDGIKSIPLFLKDGIRNPSYLQDFRVRNSALYNSFPDNVDQKMKDYYGNRRSSLIELTNMKLNATIPGRTDIEVGMSMTIKYPAMNGIDTKTDEGLDRMYSGNYLITAINHRINRINHRMSIECVKDSLFVPESQT